MTDRGLAPGDRATACPFVAFADDRDARADQPDHRHRCYAEPRPAPRALAHQQMFCVSQNFPMCPTFQDWARREAAEARPVTRAASSSAGRGAAETSTGAGAASTGAGAAAAGAGFAGAASAWLGPDQADAPRGDAGATPGGDTPPDRPSDPWTVADAVDDLGLPPRRSQRRNWAAPPPWAAGSAGGSADAPLEHERDAGSLEPPSEQAADSRLDGGEEAEGPDARAAAIAAPAFLASRGAVGDSNPEAAPPPARDRADDDWNRAMERASADRAARRPSRNEASRVPLPQVEEGVPPWERPRRYETYPNLRSRVAMPRPSRAGLSPLVVAALVVLLLALALFFVVPSLLNVGGPAGPGASPTARASGGAPASPTPKPSPTPVIYVVRHGDTLSKIATKFGVTVDQIVEANKATVKDPDKIGEGAQLIIPTPVPSEVPAASPSPVASPSG